jgi:CRP-like cAMP-binding protein
MSVLPSHLAAQTARLIMAEAVLEVPFFAPFASDMSFMSGLSVLFEPELYIAGEYIVRVGDIGNEMFIVTTGRVTVLLFQDIGEGRTDEFGLKIKKKISLEAPVHVGETAFFSRTVRTSSVLCTSVVHALKLQRSKFNRLCRTFPSLGKQIHEEFLNSAMFIYGDINSMLAKEADKADLSKLNSEHSRLPSYDRPGSSVGGTVFRFDYVAKLLLEQRRERNQPAASE